MKKVLCVFIASLVTVSLLVTACARGEPPLTTTTQATSPPSVTPTKATPTPTQTSAVTPQYGGIFKMIMRQAPRTFYSGPGPGVVNYNTYYSYESFLRYDDKGKMVPLLATDWKWSSDFKALTLSLRKGVKFHDGADFNAASAKWNLLERQAGKFGDLDIMSSVDIIDDYTIRLNVSSFDSTFVGNLANATFMYSPLAVEKNGRDWAQWHIVGTGPFRFLSYETNTMTKYDRFDGYWQKGKPYFDGVDVPVIVDATTASLSFQKGEAHGMVEVMIKEAMDLKKAGLYEMVLPLANMSILCPDTANADSVYNNKKVREAIDYAIDSQGIAKSVGYGVWEGSKQMAASTMVTYVPGLDRSYDPAKAKQLLAEAGYPNGFKTTVWARTVAPLDAMQAIVTNLRAVGIDAMLETPDSSRFTTLNQSGWRNGLLTLSIVSEGQSTDRWLLSVSRLLGGRDGKSLQRTPAWVDLQAKALAETDPARQTELAKQLVKLNHDEIMVIIPYIYARASVWYKNVQNGDFFAGDVVGHKSTAADAWFSK